MTQPSAEWRTVRLADLVADPRNARAHGERNREAVRSSLAEFGQVESLVVQAGTGRVLGGNLRLVELLAAGETRIEEHRKGRRFLSIPERASLQSLPWVEGMTALMVGNAVPPPLAECLTRSVLALSSVPA